MKRMLFGLCVALFVLFLHATPAPAANANIVWATLAGEACNQSQIDLWIKSQDPSYYRAWVNYLASDHDVYNFFASVDGDLYVTFKEATIIFSC
jgi:hypothetical protein